MRNKLEIRDVKSGRTVARKATQHFSNKRLLIAYFEEAELLFREIYVELFGKQIINRSHWALIQPVDKSILEITPTEHRIYNDFGQFGGAKIVKIYPTQEELLDKQVIEIMKRNHVD